MDDSNIVRSTQATRIVRRVRGAAEASDSASAPLLQDATDSDVVPQQETTTTTSSSSINNNNNNNNDNQDEDYSNPQQEETTDASSSRRSFFRNLLSLFLSPVIDEHGRPASIVMGLISIVVCGSCLGLLMPKDPKFPSAVYATVSSCLGYTYFFAWSVSFYPQVVSNFRRKTAVGLSVEFAALNVLGFACYTVYNVTLFFSPSVQELYRHRYGPQSHIPVQSNDVAFAVHAFVLASITLFQKLCYDDIQLHNISPHIMALIVTILGIAVTGAILSATRTSYMNWLDYVALLSICKIVVTLVKYAPQVVLNWKRRSTVGWSIWPILLDLTGGILSNLQLVLDCAALHNFSGITGNVAKLLLGLVSIVFDIVFCLQHYCFYPTNRPFLLTHNHHPRHDSMSFHEIGEEDTPEVISMLS